MPPREYWCNCSTRCTRDAARPKQVSRSAWFDHKKYRDADEIARSHPPRHSTPTALAHEQQGVQPPLPSAPTPPTGSIVSRSGTSSRPHKQARLDSSGVQEGEEGASRVDQSNAVGDHLEDNERERNIRDPGCIEDQIRDDNLANPQNEPLPHRQHELPEQLPNNLAQADDSIEVVATLEELKIAQAFIAGLRTASLDNDGLDGDVLERLRNPINEKLDFTENPELRTSIDLFLDTTTASEEVFERVRQTFHRHMTRTNIECEPLLSLHQVKRSIANITGVHSLLHDMCPDTCIAYTGPFADLEECPKCHKPRYDPIVLQSSNGQKKIPQRKFHTIPLGPQLQALWRNPETATAMRYRTEETEKTIRLLNENGNQLHEWKDIYSGTAYIEAVRAGKIKEDDMLLLLSIDGAQLYASKESDCWIYIWVVLDLAPDRRYKKRHVFPGGFIPGPKKPKNVDSFLYPGLHHVSAIMREGMMVWDAQRDTVFLSNLFLHLKTADGPGMTYLNGLAGHSGMYGCRLYCPVKGRRREGGNHYYPALLKPIDCDVPGSNHADVDGHHLLTGNPDEYTRALNKVLQSRTQAQFTDNRRDTGISKPSIFSGLPHSKMLDLPTGFGVDLMHLVSLNITELLLALWRGSHACDPGDSKETWDWAVLKGPTWIAHGKRVAEATPYLPGCFDRPPRNPVEKITSGYKAWEYLTYIYGLGPALFRGILPDRYWKNYCKLVRGLRLAHQRSVNKEQLIEAHTLLVGFVEEFEQLYYQRKESRLHFCRQSIHALLHIVPEIIRLGPGVYYTQWTMERTIGNLGEEIRQPSNPFANLSERGLRRSQVNALKCIIPDLEPEKGLPRVSVDLHGGYILLGAREERPRVVAQIEQAAIADYFTKCQVEVNWDRALRVQKWARLRLPTGQNIRGKWKEDMRPLEKIRMARMIKFNENNNKNNPKFGEVYYFFQAEIHEVIHTLALISVFGDPDPQFLRDSSNALWVCRYMGDTALCVIPIKWISSGVAMPPFEKPTTDLFYVCEKMGLDVASMGGAEDDLEDGEENGGD